MLTYLAHDKTAPADSVGREMKGSWKKDAEFFSGGIRSQGLQDGSIIK